MENYRCAHILENPSDPCHLYFRFKPNLKNLVYEKKFDAVYLTATTASTTSVPKGITTILTSYLLFGESMGAEVPSV